MSTTRIQKATELIQRDDLWRLGNSDSRIFEVAGSRATYYVTVAAPEGVTDDDGSYCTCPATKLCYHVIAAKHIYEKGN
jgi:hypothetical protein